jgi:hypothetical protein
VFTRSGEYCSKKDVDSVKQEFFALVRAKEHAEKVCNGFDLIYVFCSILVTFQCASIDLLVCSRLCGSLSTFLNSSLQIEQAQHQREEDELRGKLQQVIHELGVCKQDLSKAQQERNSLKDVVANVCLCQRTDALSLTDKYRQQRPQ